MHLKETKALANDASMRNTLSFDPLHLHDTYTKPHFDLEIHGTTSMCMDFNTLRVVRFNIYSCN